MRLTKLGYTTMVWIVSALVALTCAAIVPPCHPGLHVVLSKSWPVLATWLPVLFLILSVLMADSDKMLLKMLGKTGHIQSLITELVWATLFILAAIITTAATEIMVSNKCMDTNSWLVQSSLFLVVLSIGLSVNVARSLILIARTMYKIIADSKDIPSRS